MTEQTDPGYETSTPSLSHSWGGREVRHVFLGAHTSVTCKSMLRRLNDLMTHWLQHGTDPDAGCEESCLCPKPSHSRVTVGSLSSGGATADCNQVARQSTALTRVSL